MEDLPDDDRWWLSREFAELLMFLGDAGLITYRAVNDGLDGYDIKLTKLGWMMAVMIDPNADVESARPSW